MWHKAPSYLWGCRLQWPCCILALSSNKLPSIVSSFFPVTLPGLFSSSHSTATFLSALPQPPGSSPISAFLPHASGPLMSPNVPNPVLLTWKRPGGHGLMPTTSHVLHLPSRSLPAPVHPQALQNFTPCPLFFWMPPNIFEPNYLLFPL